MARDAAGVRFLVSCGHLVVLSTANPERRHRRMSDSKLKINQRVLTKQNLPFNNFVIISFLPVGESPAFLKKTPMCCLVGVLKLVAHRLVSQEVLAGVVIPGGGGRGRLCLSVRCHHQSFVQCLEECDVNVTRLCP